MCKDIIDSERVQIQQQLFNDQLSENRQLATENNKLRAKLAEMEEWNIDLEKRYVNLKEQIEAEQRRSTALYAKHQEFIEWTKKLFANKTIPESSKLVLWQYHYTFLSMRENPVEQEMRVSVEDTAAAVGLSTSTVAKATKKADMFEVLKVRHEKLENAKGENRDLMFLTLYPVIENPERIQMEKRHGGERVYTCHKCGSTDVDRYTVQHCRTCGENEWYGQPGIRNDADLIQAQQAQDANNHNRSKKQDASNAIASIVPIDEFYEESQSGEVPNDETIITIHTEDAIPDETSKKQDASNAIAPSTVFLKNQNQLAAELYIPTTAASCNFVENKPTCRICGPIKQWIWSPDDQDRICPRCWTPEGSKE